MTRYFWGAVRAIVGLIAISTAVFSYSGQEWGSGLVGFSLGLLAYHAFLVEHQEGDRAPDE